MSLNYEDLTKSEKIKLINHVFIQWMSEKNLLNRWLIDCILYIEVQFSALEELAPDIFSAKHSNLYMTSWHDGHYENLFNEWEQFLKVNFPDI